MTMTKHVSQLDDIRDSLREVWREGGWVYGEGSDEMYRVEQAQGEKLVICDGLCAEDASFIANAPADIRWLLSINADLLQACEVAEKYLSCLIAAEPVTQLLRSAISKARGTE